MSYLYKTSKVTRAQAAPRFCDPCLRIYLICSIDHSTTEGLWQVMFRSHFWVLIPNHYCMKIFIFKIEHFPLIRRPLNRENVLFGKSLQWSLGVVWYNLPHRCPTAAGPAEWPETSGVEQVQFSQEDFLPEPADPLTARHGLRTNSRKRPCQTDLFLSKLYSDETDPVCEPSKTTEHY